MNAKRDWVHCEGEGPGLTACGRDAVEANAKRPCWDWRAVDCPTCRPIAHERARLALADEKRPAWLKELRKAQDAEPFLPELCAELEARGVMGEWASDVVTRRGFYVLAMRHESVKPVTVWLRFRRLAVQDDGDTLLQIARESPVTDGVPLLTVSADPVFVADALAALCKRKLEWSPGFPWQTSDGRRPEAFR